MTYNPETQDFPENRYSDERYAELVALEWRIRLHADEPTTWADMRHEIERHFSLHPRKRNNGFAHRWQIMEWREHFCTLWEMRRLLEKERSAV